MARNKFISGSAIIPLASCFALTLNLANIVQSQADAPDNSSDKTAAASSNKTDSSNSGGSPAAQEIASLKQEQIQLRRMGEAIKRTRRAALDLIGECTQPIEMMGEIDIIGQDVIPIMPATAEGFGNQYIPPRPKYIKLHMDQLESLVPILQDDLDNLKIPDSEKDAASQPLQDIKGYMSDLRGHFKKLENLTKTDDYDQPSLTNEARGMDASCKGIDAARKKLLHEESQTERKEEKIEKNEAKSNK
ncbi:MAG: hypothetical protein K2X27_25635 [Candidatus Obscuribacterales bacterium]|nr:hypothetical protein [Candidatus Obscuribacterales bacterium]